AIACSGLGHICRGNETWARTAAETLHAVNVPVTLFGGGGNVETGCPYVRVRNWSRNSLLTRGWTSWHHRYLLEQVSFAFFLRQHLRRGEFDIVHAGDPNLAQQIQRHARSLGIHVVYKDGLQLGPIWCQKFDFVHVLAPYYFERAKTAGYNTQNWFVIPHLVDVRRFVPAPDRAALRARWLGQSVAEDAFVVLAVGDFMLSSSKRIDWIVDEFARMRSPGSCCLMLAGQASKRTLRKFERRARQVLGERVRLFSNLAPTDMAELYQAADVFAHAALQEPFGIVLVEAMASGLPIVGHKYEVTRWIIGDGGQVVDMTVRGELTKVLEDWQRDAGLRAELRRKARERAVSQFATEKIAPLYQALYRRIRGG
ncbi:MAG: glycosyltransferase family 4 protein, partial [Limisphaerales bacterium]